MKKKEQAIRPEIKFVLVFLILTGTLYFVYYNTIEYFAVLKVWVATVLSSILNLLGIKAIVQGEDILLGSFSLSIVEECTALFASLIYVSCVLAYPANLKSKLIGIGFGIPVIQAMNIIRLVILSITGLYYPGIFEFVHTYIWQSIFIIFVISVWLVWLERFVK